MADMISAVCGGFSTFTELYSHWRYEYSYEYSYRHHTGGWSCIEFEANYVTVFKYRNILRSSCNKSTIDMVEQVYQWGGVSVVQPSGNSCSTKQKFALPQDKRRPYDTSSLRPPATHVTRPGEALHIV